MLHKILLNSRNSKSRTNHVDLTILDRTAIPKEIKSITKDPDVALYMGEI